jgi:capsular exopolysaccharide synthesis family protein
VSKFFKALEKIEQERERAEASAPPAPRPEPPVTPFVKPAPKLVTAPPPPRPAPPPPRPAPAPAEAALPAAVVETPAPQAPAPALPPPVYGAPVARATRERHAFAWQMEPDTDGESGDIDDHLVSLLAPTSFAAEQYRAVRLTLETLHHERNVSVVGITSPGRGEGRTMTALNLAGALAQAQQARVVLVEADLRHPSVARYLGVPHGRGLCNYLLEASRSVDDVLQRPASIAFSVVPAGPASSMPYELLKSPRLGALLDELRKRFDYVLLDTPSALSFPDVGILRELVDGFLIVVRANQTPREQVTDTVGVVGRPRALGLVFNDDAHVGGPTIKPVTDGGWRRLVPRPLGATRD